MFIPTRQGQVKPAEKLWEDSKREMEKHLPHEELPERQAGYEAFPNNDQHAKCEACAFDEIEEIADSFCMVCAEHLCKSCTRDHRKNKVSRSHKIFNIDDVPVDSNIFKMMKKMLSCQDHPENDVSLRCDDHGIFVCSVCVAVKHRKCVHVTDVCSNELSNYASEEHITALLKTLKAIHESVTDIQATKQANIESLRLDASNIKKERKVYISALHSRLEQLDQELDSDTEKLLNKELHLLENEIKQCKEMRTEENLGLIKVASEHANILQQNIIFERLTKQAKTLLESSKSVVMAETVHLNFQKNTSFEEVMSVGNISVSRQSSKKNEKLCNVETSSDVLAEDVLTAKPDKSDKNTEECQEVPDAYNIYSNNDEDSCSFSSTCSDEKQPLIHSDLNEESIDEFIIDVSDDEYCSVSAITLLYDGRFAIADKTNRRVTILNTDFSVDFTSPVDGAPIDMCEFADDCLAVIFDEVKEVRKYRISSDHLDDNGHFPTKLYPISISECDEGVVILFSDETKDTEKKSDHDIIEVQIRSIHNGKIIRQIDVYKNKGSQSMVLHNTDRIRTIEGPSEMFIITESSKIHCFEVDELSEFKEEWYYKSHGNNILDEASDVATDDEGNVYVCGTESQNIHQVSSNNFMTNRVLFSVPANPTALCVDSERRLIVVGCESNDNIYVAYFQ